MTDWYLDVHELLINKLEEGLDDRIACGEQPLTQSGLARLAGMAQGNLSAIYHGRPATEVTWQRLMDAAWSHRYRSRRTVNG